MSQNIKEIKLTKKAKYGFVTMALVAVFGIGLASLTNLDMGKKTESVTKIVEKPNDSSEDVPVVVVGDEKLDKPYSVNAGIKTYYFDINDTSSNQENALIYYNGMYSPSCAIDYFYNNVAFEVKSVFEGSVIEKKVDPLYGVTIYVRSSENPELVAVYASLSDASVAVGDTVEQGTVIAKAGTNTLNSSMGNHLNFSLLKNNKSINPLNYFGKTVKEI